MVVDNFFKNIQLLMKQKGVDEITFARDMGMPQSTVNGWTRRKRIPINHLDDIAKYFGVEPCYFFMEPGTQGEVKSIERTDDFDVFINELAERNLSEDELEKFKLMGGSREYVRALRQNVEEDKIYVSPWYLKLNRAVKEYTNCDLDKKFRELSNISSDNKEQKNAKSS